MTPACGTLRHARKEWNYSGVVGNVKTNINQASELLRTLTADYVLAKALQFMGTESVDDIPQLAADLSNKDINPNAFEHYKLGVIEHIVDFAFRPADVEKVYFPAYKNSSGCKQINIII